MIVGAEVMGQPWIMTSPKRPNHSETALLRPYATLDSAGPCCDDDHGP